MTNIGNESLYSKFLAAIPQGIDLPSDYLPPDIVRNPSLTVAPDNRSITITWEVPLYTEKDTPNIANPLASPESAQQLPLTDLAGFVVYRAISCPLFETGSPNLVNGMATFYNFKVDKAFNYGNSRFDHYEPPRFKRLAIILIGDPNYTNDNIVYMYTDSRIQRGNLYIYAITAFDDQARLTYSNAKFLLEGRVYTQDFREIQTERLI